VQKNTIGSFTVTYDETGSELIALLKESQEIKSQPTYLQSFATQKHFSMGFV
jgi:hypothetical protein